jgi:hypothetical protein
LQFCISIRSATVAWRRFMFEVERRRRGGKREERSVKLKSSRANCRERGGVSQEWSNTFFCCNSCPSPSASSSRTSRSTAPLLSETDLYPAKRVSCAPPMRPTSARKLSCPPLAVRPPQPPLLIDLAPPPQQQCRATAASEVVKRASINLPELSNPFIASCRASCAGRRTVRGRVDADEGAE